jgi:hypothetical protein
MKKAILAIAAAATIAVGTLSVPTTADAQHGWRGGVGLGILGGVVAGTIIGAAIAGHPGYYGYEYDAPAPVACDGYWARRKMYDGYGNFVGWSRPQYFCR